MAPSGWEDRRVLVYVTHTATRNITGRMDGILTRHGFQVVVKTDAVVPGSREASVADRVKQGIDVLHVQPQAGADRP